MFEEKIETLYVFVSVDEITGQEGLISVEMENVWHPFLSTRK